jgi:hypothetical protein
MKRPGVPLVFLSYEAWRFRTVDSIQVKPSPLVTYASKDLALIQVRHWLCSRSPISLLQWPCSIDVLATDVARNPRFGECDERVKNLCEFIAMTLVAAAALAAVEKLGCKREGRHIGAAAAAVVAVVDAAAQRGRRGRQGGDRQRGGGGCMMNGGDVGFGTRVNNIGGGEMKGLQQG